MKNVFAITVLFLFIVLAFESALLGQSSSQTSPEFPIGAYMSTLDNTHKYNQALYDTFMATGMNIVVQEADDGTESFLENLDIIADNLQSSSDWIPFYASGLYSKWESEEDEQNLFTVGVKHNNGEPAEWKGVDCWSSIDLDGPTPSLVYGPHYRQNRLYKRLYEGGTLVDYIARFNLALANPQSVNASEEVCVIKVVHTYTVKHPSYEEVQEDTLLIDTLYVGDFNADSTFKLFDFDGSTYRYDDRFYRGDKNETYMFKNITPYYDDWDGGNGIQFCIDWLRYDDLCTLYIDYAEVYDDDGWNNYIINPNEVISNITAYSQSYSGWDNLKFWYAHDEPFSIDAIVPMKVVGEIVESAGGKPLITAQLAGWKYINGDEFNVRYFEGVQPEVTMIDWFPFAPNDNVVEKLEGLRWIFDYIHSIDPDFWYVGQAQGWFQTQTQDWCQWRKPDSTEMKASVMLALAHGVKGIVLYRFEPEYTAGPHYNCEWGFTDAIIDSNLNPTELWYVIRDNLAPRLKGKLGKTLLILDYTGDYLQRQYFTPTEDPFPEPNTLDYLTLGVYQTSQDMNWHAGFLENKFNSDDNYFLLANLFTTDNKSIYVKVTPPVPGYNNYRFRNVEGVFDETFSAEIEKQLTHIKGEGYLYQVSPVLKYGGNLIANDTVSSSSTLVEDMTIETGVNLIIKDANIYTIKDTITLEGAGFITGTGYVSLVDDGWIDINSWNHSVFKGRKDEHPKIIWGTYPGAGTVNNYKVYRKVETGSWSVLTTVSSNAREYIDSTFTIATSGGNNLSVDYKVTAVLQGFGESAYSNTVNYKADNPLGKGTGEQTIKYTYNLSENYPNPFNPSTTINYTLERDGFVELEVMDILGRRVAMLVNEIQKKGNHSINFDAKKLSSGIYLYRIKAGKFVETKKMMLIK